MKDHPRNWRHFALLLIDVQKDFYRPKLANLLPEFPTNIVRLLELCRAEGIEVIHVRSRFKADGSDWIRKHVKPPCIENTEGVEPHSFALAEPGEKVIYKHTHNGFGKPELMHHLRKRDIKFVLTAGLVTCVCVLLTTTSVVQNGLLAAVVEDGCAAGNDHEESLNKLAKSTWGRVGINDIVGRHKDWMGLLDD